MNVAFRAVSAARNQGSPAAAGGGAADYYVDAAMANDTGNGLTAGTAKKYISSGMALMAGQTGKVLQIKNGTYSHANDAITASTGSGSAGSYNTVRAETAGSVIITQNIVLPIASTYLKFDGLKWDSADNKVIEGTYLKFVNCMFKGGPSSGNNSKLTIGTNNNGADATHHILLEDCLVYGSGGRYGVLVYQCTQVILRRVVCRPDGGWSDGAGGDPEAGIIFYNSNNCSKQNCLILDAAGVTLHNWQSAFYSVYNSASSGTNATNSWRGCIAYNNKNSGFPDGASLRFDIGGSGSQTSHTVTDLVGVDSYWGINLSYSGSIGVSIDRFTLLQTTREAGYGLGGSSTGTKTIKNGIIRGFNTDDVADVSPTYINTSNNGATYSNTGVTTVNPLTNGLDEITRITAASTLKTSGESGGQMGAEIVYKWGTDGTVYGETGWDTLSANALWPWPNQALWKTCLQEGGITRGLAGYSSTLTEYIAAIV